MLKLEIEIHRPGALLIILGAMMVITTLAVTTFSLSNISADAVGGSDQAAMEIAAIEDDIYSAQQELAVLERQEEILRYQLRVLINLGDSEEIAEARNALVELLQNRAEAEARLRLSLRQHWDAQGRAIAVTHKVPSEDIKFFWPAYPELGLSAHFHDPSYEEIFGIAHHGIDIPLEQGTVIFAAADGTVESAVDNGLGFNALVIDHGGTATLYGHILEYLVSEGDIVLAGQPVARSGGMPGTPGAGYLTTGPHLHFEIFVDGVRVDPLTVLPEIDY